MAFSVEEPFQRALAMLQAGKVNDAERLFRKLLRAQPRHVAGLNLFSVLLTQLGRFEEAERYAQRALNENTTSDVTFYNYGIILKALRRPAEALERFSQALAINATVAETWNNRGAVLNDLMRYREAIADFDKAISIKSNYPEAFYNKGKALAELNFYDQSLSAYDRALALKPDLAQAWLGRGNILTKLKQHHDAFAAYDRALALKPDLAEAWLGRGNIFVELKQHNDAFTAYDRALSLKPDLAEAWLGRGNIFTKLKQHNDALAAYDRALALKSDLAEVWLGRGNIFAELKQHNESLAAYDRALAIKPDLADAWYGRGYIFTELGQYNDAFAAYDKAFTLKSDVPYAEGARLHTKMQLCDWRDFDAECSHLISTLRKEENNSTPFPLLAIPATSEDQFKCAKLWSRTFSSEKAIWQGERYDHKRIRLAYLSADFREHPVSYVLASVFEHHDRKRFETFAISFGPNIPSEMLTRLKASFDQFIDVKDHSDVGVARLLRTLEVDIVVDLMGYTAGSRTAIMAHRSSPIQVNYLGYAGTMGANYVDYILADRVVLPEDQREFYTEKVVYLPDTCIANGSHRRISDRTPKREECGLPADGFVFCSFNNSFKITPRVFSIWMRLLHQVEHSVLWLSGATESTVRNIRREAEVRGIDPDRLVFAQRVLRNEEHLARLRLGDLFLDTLPYNAHSTASDALWVGLPVLTCLGSTFVGRGAGSLLNAVGVPELITTSLDDYEALALNLAQDPSLLASLKDKLARNRDTYPLFNTERFTRHIEAAYTAMWERQQRGETPQSFAVNPIN